MSCQATNVGLSRRHRPAAQDALLTFAAHLAPTEILQIFPENREVRQGVITDKKLGQGGFGRVVENFRRQGPPKHRRSVDIVSLVSSCRVV